MTKILFSLLAILVVVAGIVAGVYFIRQKQLVSKQAVNPTAGTSQIYLKPKTLSVAPGQSFSVDIAFMSGKETVSGAAVQLSYPVTSAVAVMEIIPNAALIDSQWRYQEKSFTTVGSDVKINVIATDTSIEGYQSETETVLATIKFQAVSPGTINLTFNNTVTQLQSKTTGQDILMAPLAPAGTYTISGQTNNPTATPTSTPTATPTNTAANPTATPTNGSGGPSSTPAPTVTPKFTATPKPATAGTSNTTSPDDTTPALPVTGSAASTLALCLLGFILMGSGALFYRRLQS